jgi:hypothetical protein
MSAKHIETKMFSKLNTFAVLCTRLAAAAVLCTLFVNGSSAAGIYGPKQVIQIPAAAFAPDRVTPDTDIQYTTPGVRVVTGNKHFQTPIVLPEGAKVVSLKVYINTNGDSASLFLFRINPLNENSKLIATKIVDGSEIKKVRVKRNFIIQPGRAYKLVAANFQALTEILYGAELTYRLPK